ncbi:MAG: hydantoinase/oxoprolinase family protein [Desulfobacteraceae bacterium]|nr:MAG: hydantoinase/oxoprolinase family protein [Desulfobacteraceae bacterium]
MIIGLDVGGTHTDVVLLGKSGIERAVKVPTDESDLFNTILTGIDKITAGIDSSAIKRIVLSTTLITNAVVQNKLPEVGMIVSSGPGINPEYYRTNSFYYNVSGSIDHRGREVEPVDRNEIEKIAWNLKKGGIKYVGVVGKFSVRNPSHEQNIARILGNFFDKVFTGHRISGNLNFPRRIATTHINTAAYPIHKNFFDAVKKSLQRKGLNVPIDILKADGGTMSLDSSTDFPGHAIFSGPAASAVGAMAFAPDNEDCIVLDIGGTTTDIAVLINHAPVLNPLGISLGRYKTLIRSLETHSIAVGGDSSVTFDNNGIKIGPERMGPAMLYGGPVPTITDALAVLGKIKDCGRDKSYCGIESLALNAGVSAIEMASLIFDKACNMIISEIRDMVSRINSKPVYTIHEVMEGYRLNPKKILLIGGPAPYFAGRIEALSEFRIGVVPRWEVANAIGAAIARTTCEVTLFSDTEQGFTVSVEEGFKEKVAVNFSMSDALKTASALLMKKAVKRGADASDLEMEVIESLQFNMVKGFCTTGKNIRVRVQVRPGLIHGYDSIADMLTV